MSSGIFDDKISEYNRHCWIAALLSLLGAVVAWTVVVSVYIAVALFFDVVNTMNPALMRPPSWFLPLGASLAVGLFLWAVVERWRRRYRPVTDRSIIGWHLIPEVLLLPPRVTFAIWDHIAARVSLPAWQRSEARRLLQIIVERRRAPATALSYDFPDAALLAHLLLALQLTGWIDLHHGEDDWFYAIRSDAESDLRLLAEEA